MHQFALRFRLWVWFTWARPAWKGVRQAARQSVRPPPLPSCDSDVIHIRDGATRAHTAPRHTGTQASADHIPTRAAKHLHFRGKNYPMASHHHLNKSTSGMFISKRITLITITLKSREPTWRPFTSCRVVIHDH